nr:MAG TPA: hypothetical protein [Caudoviricetes sp.]
MCSTNFVVMTVAAIFSAIFIYFLKVVPPMYISIKKYAFDNLFKNFI